MRSVPLLLIALGLGSCATTFNHPVQEVTVTPLFQGAAQAQPVRVLITSGLGTYRAALPVKFAVTPDTWTHVTVKIVEPCFKQSEHALPRSVTPWILGDALGFAVTAGAAGVFALAGDGLDGTMWSYRRDVKVPVEPVENFEACLVESRKRPSEPFPASRDPIWQDPRDYSGAKVAKKM